MSNQLADVFNFDFDAENDRLLSMKVDIALRASSTKARTTSRQSAPKIPSTKIKLSGLSSSKITETRPAKQKVRLYETGVIGQSTKRRKQSPTPNETIHPAPPSKDQPVGRERKRQIPLPLRLRLLRALQDATDMHNQQSPGQGHPCDSLDPTIQPILVPTTSEANNSPGSQMGQAVELVGRCTGCAVTEACHVPIDDIPSTNCTATTSSDGAPNESCDATYWFEDMPSFLLEKELRLEGERKLRREIQLLHEAMGGMYPTEAVLAGMGKIGPRPNGTYCVRIHHDGHKFYGQVNSLAGALLVRSIAASFTDTAQRNDAKESFYALCRHMNSAIAITGTASQEVIELEAKRAEKAQYLEEQKLADEVKRAEKAKREADLARRIDRITAAQQVLRAKRAEEVKCAGKVKQKAALAAGRIDWLTAIQQMPKLNHVERAQRILEGLRAEKVKQAEEHRKRYADWLRSLE